MVSQVEDRNSRPPDEEEEIKNFCIFTQAKILENWIRPNRIINMDEIPLTFDLPLTRTVHLKGEPSVRCHLCSNLHSVRAKESINGDSKRTTTPEKKFPKHIVGKVQKNGKMI